MLSWFLHKEGKTFLVIDDNESNSPSRVAAGVINPVTGRRYVTTWMIDEVMPFAIGVYEEMEKLFNKKFVYQKNIIDFFPSVQMREAFIKRITEDDTYVHSFPDQNHFNQYFHHDFGCGEISPCYTIDLAGVMSNWKNKLEGMGAFQNEKFNLEELQLTEDGIRYGEISAEKIIFCNGVEGMQSEYFKLLPFAPNKGEVMIIECKDLTTQHIFKRSMVLAPLPTKDLFWFGSNYLWDFKDELPSEKFYSQSKSLLEKWLKLPFKILEHKASIRPATLERRPFVGLHPHFPSIGILNGMGSKGTSLAPFFGNQLVQHLVHGFPITDEANVNRFTRILNASSKKRY